MKSSILLAGASAIALGMSINTAQAASPTVIYGGGSTLASKVYRDIFNCFAAAAVTNPTTASNGVFVNSATYPAGFNIQYPTAFPTNATGTPVCTKGAASNIVALYEPVGSGAGIGAWEAASPNGNYTAGYTAWGWPAVSNTIAFLDDAVGAGSSGFPTTLNPSGTACATTATANCVSPYPQIQFSGSDAYLSSAQITTAQTNAGGPVFQLPTFATPIPIIVGNPSKLSSLINVKFTTADVCNLFSGASNHTAGHVTFSTLIVRADGSGTSFILSDWLAQNCSASLGFTSANGFPSTKPSWAAVAALNGTHLTVTAVSGSGGVSSTVGGTQGYLGYVSPDFVQPIVTTSTAYPGLVNGQAPSVAAVKTHLTHASYPTTYDPYSIGQVLNDSLVAAGNTSGYPIVGYTFIDVYACYSTTYANGLIGGPAAGSAVLKALNYLYATTNKSVGNILAAQGFVQGGPAVVNLLKSSTGPLGANGIQNSSCPSS
jgi:hypothetical protein